MKKILFFVLITNFVSAQHPDLLNTNWKITKITSDNYPDQFPPNAPVINNTQFFATAPYINSSIYNGVSGDLNYIGNNSFTVNSRACTLAQYMDDNGEVDQFFNRICAFFDITGKLLFQQNYQNEKIVNIDIRNFNSGSYLVKINDAKATKIIKN